MKNLTRNKRVLFALFVGTSLLIGCHDNPIGSGSYTWSQCQGLQGFSLTGFATCGANLIAGAYHGSSSYVYLFVSTDQGASWKLTGALPVHNRDTNRTGPHPISLILIPRVTILNDHGELFAGIGGVLSGAIYSSPDGGYTWHQKDPSFDKDVHCFASFDGTIFAGGAGVSFSTDHGASWQATGAKFGASGLAVVGSRIFACTNGYGIYRSDDRGAHWVEVNTADLDFQSLTTIGTDVFAGFSGGDPNGGVLRSTDYGTSWSLLNVGSIYYSVNALCTNGADLFAGTNTEILLSFNRGETWMNISGGTSVDSSAIISICASDSYLLVGTNGNGTWRGYISSH